MSYTNHTPNYNLPQYVGTDKPTFLGDFNNAMETIDTALHNNAENAGEGLAQLQEAQNQLTETQSAQSELNEEVSNIGGIASTVNQNVQQALTAANDATTAANSAKSQIEPAVTAANNASAAAAEAKTVADQNTTSVNELNARVTALEEAQILEISGVITTDGFHPNITSGTRGCKLKINAPSGMAVKSVETVATQFEGFGSSSYVTITAGETTLATYNSGNQMNGTQNLNVTGNETDVTFDVEAGGQADFLVAFSYTVEFKKV